MPCSYDCLSRLAGSAALRKRLEEERKLQQYEIIIPADDDDNAALPSAKTNPSATPATPTISAPIDQRTLPNPETDSDEEDEAGPSHQEIKKRTRKGQGSASAGLGKLLAIKYAKTYSESKKALVLILTARRMEKLQSVKSEIESTFAGVAVEIAALDVSVAEDVFTVFETFTHKYTKINVCVANAGVLDELLESGSWQTYQAHETCVMTNVCGFMATVQVALKHFKEVGEGQVVAIGSVASSRGIPRMSAYSASKVFVNHYMDAIRDELVGSYPKIKLTTILPGYVQTDMADLIQETCVAFVLLPFAISGPVGARLIFDSIEKRKPFAVIPFWPWALAIRLTPWLPGFIYRLLVAGNRRKVEK
ncbi:hypothetical protein HDV05_006023 [Chytridiales sp. JEL 0842]|nr:hypothetical protein HDV05_006023 [Chytridiales sp. JEL 0842]